MATNKFAEIPYYMLSDYWSKLEKYYKSEFEDSTKSTFEELSPVKFEDTKDNEWSVEHGFLDWNGEQSSKDELSRIVNARLYTPNHTIIAHGGSWTNLYVKKPNFGYRKVAIRPKWEEKWNEDSWFKFDLKEIDANLPGIWNEEWRIKVEKNDHPNANIEKISREKFYLVRDITSNGPINLIQSGSVLGENTYEFYNVAKSPNQDTSFSFKRYITKTDHISDFGKLEPEDEFYLRKDSLFFNWFRDYLKYLGSRSTNFGTKSSVFHEYFDTWNHVNFINEHKDFLYIGYGIPIHQSNKEWMVRHHSMKNFMIDAMPPNDTNEANKVLLWETMDRVYEEPYNMMRNIDTLLDPDEIPEQMLPCLGSFYNIDTSQLTQFSEIDIREFVKSLPFLLKKKGTQASLSIIWRAIVNSKNKVTFYERWHEEFANEKITNIILEKYKVDEIIDNVHVLPGGLDGVEGGGPSAPHESGFPNPLDLENFAILYCYDKNIEAGIEIWKSDLYYYWNHNLVNVQKIAEVRTSAPYLIRATQSTNYRTIGFIYSPGAKLYELDVPEHITKAVHSSGRLFYFALKRVPRSGENEISYNPNLVKPEDKIDRFLSTEPSFYPYNTPSMVECRNAGVFPLDTKYYIKITLNKIEKETIVECYWESSNPVYTYKEKGDWLTYNFIMNYCYKDAFGPEWIGEVYKPGRLVKTIDEDNELVLYWSISLHMGETKWLKKFVAPSTSLVSSVLEHDIMYNINEPRYQVKLVLYPNELETSTLSLWWANKRIYYEEVPKELETYKEVLFYAQNFVIQIGDYKYLAWPRFMDRLDDEFGAEMESKKWGNCHVYWYKIRRILQT